MIPKIIHYCWFGKSEMDSVLKGYIKTWKIKLHDYEIICWNEENYDVNKYAFTREAYQKKKYAFVSDMVRLEVLYIYGGIYLDTDVEVLSSFDKFLDNELFFGYDSPSESMLATCLMGTTPKNEFIKHLFDIYTKKNFIGLDGTLDETPNTVMLTNEIQKFYGVKLINNGKVTMLCDGIPVFPMEYFHPLDLLSGKMYKTSNTVAIHWHSLLWVSKKTRIVKFFRQKILVPIIGEKRYKKFIQGIKR